MIVAVGVAAGAAQRTLAGDLDRQRWCVSGQDPSPRAQDPIHLFTIMHAMKRRTLLQWLGGVAGTVAAMPLRTIRLFAQPRDLTHESMATLHEIAATVLPASLGRAARSRHRRQICRVDARLPRGRRDVARVRPPATAEIRRVAGARLHRAARRAGAPRRAREVHGGRRSTSTRADGCSTRRWRRPTFADCLPRPTGQHVVSPI